MSLGRHRRPRVAATNVAEYGDGWSTSSMDALSALAMRFIDEYASLCVQHEPYSAIFISVTRGQRWLQRHRKTWFSFILLHPMLSNANPSKHWQGQYGHTTWHSNWKVTPDLTEPKCHFMDDIIDTVMEVSIERSNLTMHFREGLCYQMHF